MAYISRPGGNGFGGGGAAEQPQPATPTLLQPCALAGPRRRLADVALAVAEFLTTERGHQLYAQGLDLQSSVEKTSRSIGGGRKEAAWRTVEAKAQALAKRDGITFEKAVDVVLRAEPQFYTAYVS
jgi:hypothetical protein